MKQNWDPKPTAKRARIVSSTFIVTGLLCFLLYTWNDYTENTGIFQSNKLTQDITTTATAKQNDINIDIVDNDMMTTATSYATSLIHVTTTIQPRTTAHTMVDEKEVHQNSMKVEEQISSMRKEIASAASESTTRKNSSPTLLSSEEQVFNPMKNFHQILNTSPVVLFIDSQSSSRDEMEKGDLLKKILQFNYEISPEFAVVDLSKHENGNILQYYIKQYKLNRNDNAKLPYLFINSRSVLDNNLKDHLMEFHDSGKLLTRFKNFAEGKVIFDKLELPSNN
ncbi:hypothetical protein MOUN0_L02652 [Monosporozyma unispora]|nr:hypothetical protein C6P44_000252 [Kazachstania unispora]